MSSDESEDGFDESPVPSKKRRTNPPSPVFDDADSDFSFNDVPAQSPARQKRASTSTRTSKENSAEPEERPAKKAPKPKHLIRINAHGAELEDTFHTQAPDQDISSSPWRLRGARWQKLPPEAPTPEPVTRKDDSRPTSAHHSRRPFAGHTTVENDARKPPAGKNQPRSRSTSIPGQQATLPAPSQDFDFAQELADLPSDAFASSANSTQDSPQVAPAPGKPSALRAPQQGLQQLTLWGAQAPQGAAEKGKSKKHNWPLANKEEPPTHHKLDLEAMKTYIYPTNLGKIRDYQFSIVKRGLFHNLLVALPTGLGKTFIAATIMLNWYRWTEEAQIVFVAPTKPLVTQQVQACFGIAGIPRSDTVMLTGGISPGLRAEEWNTKRVFFMTPQTIMNDLKTGICDPKRLVLIVVDEAHRATGNYAYVELVKFVRRFNESFRVLALTATPGGNVEAVQAVIDGLKISRVEIRTEFSIDIRQYVFSRDIEIQTFQPNEEMELIMDLFSKVLNPMLQKLRSQNAHWTADPMQLSAYGLNQSRMKWSASPAGKNAAAGIKGMIQRIFAVLASLAHNIELLKYHGISPFYHNLVAWRNEVQSVKGGKYEREVTENEHFQKMMTTIGFWIKNDTFMGHPKLEYLQEVVLKHFVDAAEGRGPHAPSETKIMIFAHYRDSAEDIVRVLKRHDPIIRPHVFVGQAASKGSEGMDQKRQLEVIRDFRTNKYNTLVATSIGEEGLDIGEIDRIICYDSSASPIRMLQRMGRTGRKRAGNIVLLLMKGKEENSYTSAKDGYEKMQQLIADGNRFDFHEDSARRILPKGVEPVVDKCVVEIPPENSQADLPEPKKRGRAPKRPPKKFHMPDGVRTGFVTASHMDDEDDDTDRDQQPRPPRKRARPSKVTEEIEEMPPLGEVLLNQEQAMSLFRKYQEVPSGEDSNVSVPSLTSHPPCQRIHAPVGTVQHSRSTVNMVRVLSSMRGVDTRRISTMIKNARKVNLDDFEGNHRVLSDAEAELQAQAGPKKVNTKSATTASARVKATVPKPAAKLKKKPTVKATTKAGRAAAAKIRLNNRQSNDDDAIEADESSPPPTDPRLGIGTQGIDLGSDTSGEEEMEGEPSSDLRDFVVESDEIQPDTTTTSSIEETTPESRKSGKLTTSKPAGRQRSSLARLVASDSENEDDTDDDGELPSLNTLIQTRMTDPEFQGTRKEAAEAPKRKRRVVEDSSD